MNTAMTRQTSVNLTLTNQYQRLGVQQQLHDLLSFSCLLIFSRALGINCLSLDVSGLQDNHLHKVSLHVDDPDQSLEAIFADYLQKKHANSDAIDTRFLISMGAHGHGSQENTHYHARLNIHPREQSHTLTLEYAEDYFDETAAQDILEKITIILNALVTTPDIRFSDVSLITSIAQKIIADPKKEISKNLYEMTPAVFLRVAEQYAEKVAIRQGQYVYAYSELKNVAEFLAQALIEKGLRPGETVLVSGQSSFGTIAGFIAVMLAGGVLVSLDQTLPSDRQKQIIDLSQARFIILATDENQALTDPLEDYPAHQLNVPIWPRKNDLSKMIATHTPVVELAQDASAYIFFTSGSTGVPKGVLGTHLGLAHFLDWQRTHFPLGPDDRSAQITALSFDVVLRDIFYPLTSGACVCIPERSWVFDAHKILGWMQENQITILHSVPSLMKAWLQSEAIGQPFKTLRYIFFAGEPLSNVLLERFKRTAGLKTRIINLYGPTETTLAKLANEITDIRLGIQPIGKPQPGVDVLILKDRKNLCALHEVGEIAIRTPYRSKGYYKNQALTDEVFIKNPWRDDDQDLIYCTGDLGKYNSEGKIEIYGRVDAQIKIRGVRMEPNEIEAHISTFPGIANAAVTARASDQQEKTLFAFIVKDEANHLDAHQLNRELREFLKAKLPEAMVPKRLIVIKELPYLPNGKLNRKAIAALDVGQDESSIANADLNRLDQNAQVMIAGLEKAIGFKVHDLHASFVDLGGDSLSYIQSSLVIEKTIGWVPENWEKMPIIELTKLRKSKQFFTYLPSSIAIRAISILLIIVGHYRPSFEVQYTSIMLLIVSGWSIGKYQLGSVLTTETTKNVVNAAKNIILPVILFFLGINLVAYSGFIHSISDPFKWQTVLLFSNFIEPNMDGFFGLYWFIMILSQCYFLVVVLLKIKPLLEFIKRDVYQNTLILSMALLVIAMLLELIFNTHSHALNYRLPHLYLWLLFLGMSFANAETVKQKGVLIGVVLVLFGLLKAYGSRITGFPYEAFFWGKQAIFPWFVIIGSVVLCLKPFKVPKIISNVVHTIAGASLFIYLTHMLCYVVVSDSTTTSGLIKISALCVIESIILSKLWESVKGYFNRGALLLK